MHACDYIIAENTVSYIHTGQMSNLCVLRSEAWVLSFALRKACVSLLKFVLLRLQCEQFCFLECAALYNRIFVRHVYEKAVAFHLMTKCRVVLQIQEVHLQILMFLLLCQH